MLFTPNTIVQILHNVPFDMTYSDTIFFDNVQSQFAYFNGLAKYTLTKQSYHAPGNNTLRVELPEAKLYDCNYIMFQNTDYSNKWFYAFITGYEYINPETTLITYSIDLLQTWHFDYTLTQCFIEREHTLTDNYGEHIVDEGLETGELVNGAYHIEEGWDDYSICVVTAVDVNSVKSGNFEPADGGYYSLIYSGLDIAVFPANNSAFVSDLQNFLNKLNENNRTSSILSIFMCPEFMVQSKSVGWLYKFSAPKGREVLVPSHQGGAFSYANKYGSYKPKNNKLYNYPYSTLMVTNGDGDSKIFKWENFFGRNDGNVGFREDFQFSPAPSASTMPYHYGQNAAYRATASSNTVVAATYRTDCASEDALLMNDFVLCAYATDTFRAWLAQKKVSLPYEIAQLYIGNTPARHSANQAYTSAMQAGGMGGGAGFTPNLNSAGTPLLTGAIGSAATGAMVGGPVGAGVGLAAGLAAGGADMLTKTASFIVDQLSQYAQAKLLPEGINGTIAGNGYSMAMRLKRFTYTQRMIKGENAEIIDNFFTMFGYKTHRMGIPIRNARPHWSFIKTMNCTIRGSIPSDDAASIRAIYDNGVRWWKDGDELGNYALDNSPR